MKIKSRWNKTKKFKDLAIGTKFEFNNSGLPLGHGLETGHWVKTSNWHYEKPGMKCRVGILNVEVIELS